MPTPNKLLPGLLRPEEVAVLLGLSVTGLYSLVQKGLVPPPRKFGYRGRWVLADLEEMLRALPLKTPRKGPRTPKAKGAPRQTGLGLARKAQGGTNP